MKDHIALKDWSNDAEIQLCITVINNYISKYIRKHIITILTVFWSINAAMLSIRDF